MSLSDLSSPSAVHQAISEFDKLGREIFLRTYGFGMAREFFLYYQGKKYDSKAIAGVAYKYQFPHLGHLPREKFSGGISKGGAATKLRELGFEVR
jgi:hypothetical protein